MSNYVIITDSVSDLPPNLPEEWNVEIIPYVFTLDGKEYLNYLDWRQISAKDFYDTLRAGKSGSTTLVTQARYIETWEPHLKAGKDILYMCLSSALSKSFEQCQLAAAEMREAFPDRKIIIIDTKAASLGIGLLAYYAAKGRDEGKTLDELGAYIEGLIPNLQHWVMADDLHHLRRGGRVSGAQAFVGTMLSVKPMLTMTQAGKLTPMAKMRGHNRALEFIVEQFTFHQMDPADQPIFISHSDSAEMAEQLKNLLVAKHGQREFIINPIGPVIGSHTGPGTIATMFLGNARRP